MSEKSVADGPVHPNDLLYQYICKKFPVDGHSRYFTGGARDAALIAALIREKLPAASDLRILDFAAGYGRVVRHMQALFPSATIAASDIHANAHDFLGKVGVAPYLSSYDPGALSLGGAYDFIYVLSLFSHLPDHSFAKWLQALYAYLRPGGFLMVTANGEFARQKLPEQFLPYFDPEKGYGFRPMVVDQPDLNSAEYGSMSISEEYLRSAVANIDPAATVRHRAGAWFGHQDEWLIGRPA